MNNSKVDHVTSTMNDNFTITKIIFHINYKSDILKLLLTMAGLVIANACFAETGLKQIHVKNEKFTISEGKGWSICENMRAYLNKTDQQPRCSLAIDNMPGIHEPKWQNMNIEENLPLIHQMELLLGKTYIYYDKKLNNVKGGFMPSKNFEQWQIHFNTRIKKQQETPQLRKTRLKLSEDGKLETIIQYNQNINGCKSELERNKRIQHPFSYSHTFVYDNNSNSVVAGKYWDIISSGKLLTYNNKTYLIDLFFGSNNQDVAGHISAKRLEHTDDPSVIPPYLTTLVCSIRFDYPFQRD